MLDTIKKNITIILVLLIGSQVIGQIHNPVKWSTTYEKVSETEYDLVAKAVIAPKWHLYSQTVPEDGPLPTVFVYESHDAFSLIDKTIEGTGKTVFDPVFKMQIKYFEREAIFKQRVRVNSTENLIIKGEVEYMACDDKRCLPPKFVDLVFKLPTSKPIEKVLVNTPEKITKVPTTNKSQTSSKKEAILLENKKVENTTLLPKVVDTIIHKAAEVNDGVADNVTPIKYPKEYKANNNTDHLEVENSSDRSIFTLFLLAFISGFAALLTPCVFPMIPMTVSFFTKQSKTKAVGIRNAIIYGVSIIVIYVLLGSVITVIFGAGSMNALATSVTFNIVFFFLLLVFAISFLGGFEIMLPNSWLSKVDAQANKGGLLGIFFMALALAVVSFSCTGPIVGTILVEASSKGGIAPIMGMFGFAMAIALPFTLFAAFPGWLNALPKSGGWLNTMKVVLGFLELALAFKFLSQADLVLQLHWFEREVFLAVWIAIFAALTLYLLGKIYLPHDTELKHISVGRLLVGLVTFSFTVYLIPGLWGAPLNLVSAFPPPLEYSESPYGVGYKKTGTSNSSTHVNLPDGAHLSAPHDIISFNDYDQGLSYAKKVNKPVLIDFTGWACVNCRKMEQNVWPKPKILNILKDEVVLISLYVDDKRLLATNEVTDSKLRPGKKLKYIGQKWSELQELKYKANAQPFYVLMDFKENNLIPPIGYTSNVNNFHNWLTKGIAAFK